MKTRKIIILLLVIPSFAVRSDIILWLKPDFPPANFVSGVLRGLGYADRIEELIVSQLNRFEHGEIVASYEGIIQYLKQRNGCAVGLIKTPERESFLEFTEVALLVYPNGLITRKDKLDEFSPYIDDKGFLSVKRLAKDSELIAGVADGRIYEGAIDEELITLQAANKVVRRSGDDVLAGLIRMVDLGRIDYTFGYPVEVEYHYSLGVVKNEMAFIKIKEMPAFIESYIVCRKNEWGRRVVNEINEVLLQHRTTPEFLHFYEFWLDIEIRTKHSDMAASYFKNLRYSEN